MGSVSKRVTVPEILSRKGSPDKLVALTAYDYGMASILDGAGVDIILVGDSVGTVFQGFDNTLSVTVDQIIYHTTCVNRAVVRSLVVADMPFMSYQGSREHALTNAGRIVKESGAAAVKVEGGVNVAEAISYLVNFDIPVMGHIGLTPQSYHRMGGHKVQGRARDLGRVLNGHPGTRERILDDAKAVESAGAFAVVLEGIPEDLGEEITKTLKIPTIGIGAGKNCDGQILVLNDLIGLTQGVVPKFVKRYLKLEELISKAVSEFGEDVKSGNFPGDQHVFKSTKADKVVSVR